MYGIGATSVSYIIGIRTKFDTKLSTLNLDVKIPTSLTTTNVECKASSGKAKYSCEENVIVWR